ncbi:alpha/beta-hydrolase [Lindgomyces ingoldianus]|uniref:Alpha/beta-hydrolase n=1 Tax=Lindgomyces ingoldianus TaxID=673940 RepID=A0ACB6QGF3_9PLEO|nr:alpha/beta-hydrolase [Lindgomyces ingoldianus]KAF2465971.1 alpha/beta-hydrolase [Lindgomyces ingoldianus]
MSYPPSTIIEPQPNGPHTHTIILLHGRSSTAKEFASDLLSLKTSASPQNLTSSFPTFRWVFPDAGQRWCTPFKEKRSAWCDTFSLDDLSERKDLNVAGLRDGIHFIKDIIEDEANRLGGRSDRIILGGFSQGAATALWSLFTGAAIAQGTLGGFIGLSGWMPFTAEAKQAADTTGTSTKRLAPAIQTLSHVFLDILGLEPFVSTETIDKCVRKMPIYLGHGTDDIPVNIRNCHDLSAIFRALEAKIEVHEYMGAERNGHWIKEPEQLDDIVLFVRKFGVD